MALDTQLKTKDVAICERDVELSRNQVLEDELAASNLQMTFLFSLSLSAICTDLFAFFDNHLFWVSYASQSLQSVLRCQRWCR